MVRGVIGAIVGYAVFAISAVALFNLSGQQPHDPASVTFMALSTLYGIAFAILAGYLATTIAAVPQLRWAVVVFVLMAAAAIVSLVARPGAGAVWSQLAGLLMSPGALLGGVMATRQLRRRALQRVPPSA